MVDSQKTKIMTKNKVWIRIAGNSIKIKADSPYHWRAFINKKGPAVPIRLWEIYGEADNENMVHGSSSKLDKNGLLAWIDFYGNVTIKNGVAKIHLLKF